MQFEGKATLKLAMRFHGVNSVLIALAFFVACHGGQPLTLSCELKARGCPCSADSLCADGLTCVANLCQSIDSSVGGDTVGAVAMGAGGTSSGPASSAASSNTGGGLGGSAGADVGAVATTSSGGGAIATGDASDASSASSTTDGHSGVCLFDACIWGDQVFGP